MPRRLTAVSTGALLVALTAPVARAQAVSGFADDRFEPAGADSDWMSVESLHFDGHLRPVFALVGDWAVKPLVAYDNQGHEIASLVGDQLFAHLDAALILWNRARVDLNVPVALVNSGDPVVLGTQTYAPPTGAALGDLRLGADVFLFRNRDVTAGVGLQLFVPTGQTSAYSGDGGWRLWPRLEVAGEHGPITWAGRVGVQLRPSDSCACNLTPGTEVNGALGAGWRPRAQWLVGPELLWSHAAGSGAATLHGGTPVELLLGGHYAATPTWTFTVGFGAGLDTGAGSPAFRAVFGAAYAFRRAEQPPRSE